jgi:hypothetical protein
MGIIRTWFRNLLSSSSQTSASPTGSSNASGGSVPKRCYEILLPRTHNDGRPVNPEMLLQAWDELAARFGAVSYHPQAIRGVWFHEGRRYEDELVRLSLDVEDTSDNRAFFATYKLNLQERFEQIVIYIRSYLVEII